MKLNLQSASLTACLLSTFCIRTSSSLRADEPPSAARNIRFVLEDEPFVDKMPEDYQPQEDLRYAAIVHGFAPLLVSMVQVLGQPPAPWPLHESDVVAIASLDSSPAGARLRELREKDRARHRFKARLIDDYDSKLAPGSGPHMALKTNLSMAVQSLRSVHWQLSTPFLGRFTETPAQHPPLQEYVFLAPSAEEAKQFAEDFLHAYDEGFVPWLRKLVDAEKAALEKSRDEAQAKLTEFDKKIADASREVEGVEELGQEAISDLKVKRTLLKVELAGVKARISSIEDKLSAAKRMSDVLVAKLSDLKVSADIDLASLVAQQKVLDELIDGQRRLMEIARLRFERRPFADRIHTVEEGLPRCDEILADLKPFQLIDDTVVIRPLRFRAE